MMKSKIYGRRAIVSLVISQLFLVILIDQSIEFGRLCTEERLLRAVCEKDPRPFMDIYKRFQEDRP